VSTRPLLDGPIHAEPVDELATLREEVSDLRAELEDLKSAYEQDRNRLGNLLHGLRAMFGGETVPSSAPSSGSGPLDPSRYAPWKEKFRGQTSNAIDILVKYEAGLSRKQLAAFLRVQPGSGSMAQIIFKLNSAGLIVKDGELIRLKRL